MQNNSALHATMRPASGGKSLATLSTYEERQEALKCTTIMEDDVNHRKNHYCSKTANENATNGNEVAHMPPPPPQFANSPPKVNTTLSVPKTGLKANGITTKQSQTSQVKPPSSPAPDYDNINIEIHSTTTSKVAKGYNNSTNAVTKAAELKRHSTSTRLNTVSIGEYETQRKEPSKLEFVGMQKRQQYTRNEHSSDNLRAELRLTLHRSNLKQTNGQLEHQSNCPLQHNYENCQYQNGNNVEHITRKLQIAGMANRTIGNNGSNNNKIKNNSSSTGTGILKNSSRNSNNSSGFGKNSEKTISFGN